MVLFLPIQPRLHFISRMIPYMAAWMQRMMKKSIYLLLYCPGDVVWSEKMLYPAVKSAPTAPPR
jgi:hypothetical protein